MPGITRKGSYPSKVGPKGQIVISKEFRERYRIMPGSQIEQLDTGSGILIRPAQLIKEWQRLATRVGKKWPKGVSAVEAIREDREKLND